MASRCSPGPVGLKRTLSFIAVLLSNDKEGVVVIVRIIHVTVAADHYPLASSVHTRLVRIHVIFLVGNRTSRRGLRRQRRAEVLEGITPNGGLPVDHNRLLGDRPDLNRRARRG